MALFVYVFSFHWLRNLEFIFFIEIILMAGSILLFLDFAFSRLFADSLIVLILLIYLNILANEHFGKNYRRIILAAVMEGTGFYAKAYTFYFILIHLPIVILIVEKKVSNKSFSIISLKKISVSVIVLLFTSAFWIIMLHNKYGNYVVGQKNITGTISDIYQPKRIIASVPA